MDFDLPYMLTRNKNASYILATKNERVYNRTKT